MDFNRSLGFVHFLISIYLYNMFFFGIDYKI